MNLVRAQKIIQKVCEEFFPDFITSSCEVLMDVENFLDPLYSEDEAPLKFMMLVEVALKFNMLALSSYLSFFCDPDRTEMADRTYLLIQRYSEEMHGEMSQIIGEEGFDAAAPEKIMKLLAEMNKNGRL